jgi:hypothetical protein
MVISRRDFVASTALAAALGLNARLAISPAFAQKTPDPAKGFVSYKIGSAEVTALYDGIWEKAHDPAFIANASVEDVKNAMTSAGRPTSSRSRLPSRSCRTAARPSCATAVPAGRSSQPPAR